MGLHERVLSACKNKLATYSAMKVTGTMILLYGAGGEPGRGEIPMELLANSHLMTSLFFSGVFGTNMRNVCSLSSMKNAKSTR